MDFAARLTASLTLVLATTSPLANAAGLLPEEVLRTVPPASTATGPVHRLDRIEPEMRLPVPAPAPAPAAPAARSSIRGDSAGSEEARPPAASSASPAMASHDTSIVYPLWYATNRTQTQDAAQNVAFSDAYSTEMNYGKVLVDIPEDFLKAPGWLALFRSAERLIRVREPTPLAPDALFDDMRQQLSQYEGREALIYLHGFHTTFVEAAQRAAALGYQLKIPLTLFFSWPSQGRTTSYVSDLTLIERSQDRIAGFIVDAVKKSGATRVHIIAHSMGNEGLLRAMLSPLMQQAIAGNIRFGQIILAAPDVDKGEFNEKGGLYTKVAERVTLYASSNDLALNTSKKLRPELDRAGLMPPPVKVKGVDVVDVGDVNLTLLGHSYVVDEIHVLEDMFALIKYNKPPQERFGISPFSSEQPKNTHWILHY